MANSIERIIVKIMANATDYLKSVNSVIAATVKMAADVTGHVTKMVSNITASLAKVGVAATHALGKVAVAAVHALGHAVVGVTKHVAVLAASLAGAGAKLGSAGLGALGRLGSSTMGMVGRLGSGAMSLAGRAIGGGGPLGMMMGVAGGVAGGLGIHAGLSQINDLLSDQVRKVVQAGIEWERYSASFEVMTGSLDKGRAVLSQIEELAIKTPYQFRDLAEQAQKLMGMGVEGNNVLPTLSKLGDVAAGDVEKMKRLSLAYGQVMAAGRFMGTELRQFTEAGVGVADFAKTAGMNAMEFRAAMEAGMIGADNVAKTLNRLTSEGGRFYGMNEKQNQTVAGQWNALTETVDKFRRRLGTALFKEFNVAGEIGSLTRGLEAMFDEKAIASWMARASKALQPIITDLKVMATIGKDAIGNIFGQAPSWEGVSGAIKSFGKEVTITFLQLADAIEMAVLQVQIFSEKVDQLTGQDNTLLRGSVGLAGSEKGRSFMGSLFSMWAGGGIWAAAGEANAGGGRMDELRKRQEELRGRGSARSRVEAMIAAQESSDWYNRILSGMKRAFGGTGDQIGIPITLSPDALRVAGEIKKTLTEGITPWEKFDVMNRRIFEARHGIMGTDKGMAAAFAGPWAGAMAGMQAPGAIGDKEALHARYQAFLELERGLGMGGNIPLPSAVARGSGEASAIINAQAQGPLSIQQRMATALDIIKAKSEAMEKEMQEFNNNIKNLPVLSIVKKGKP